MNETPESSRPSLAVRRAAAPPAWALADSATLERLKSRPGRVVVALTGGIASGKSTVSELLAAFGAEQLDLDHLARQAVVRGSPGFDQVVELFGRRILRRDGDLDRSKIAGLAFKNPTLKAGLEAIVHPVTWRLMAEALPARDEEKLLVISIPLLFEAGLETFFSPIILCFARPEVQRKRLLDRAPALSRRQAGRLLAGQWPATDKITRVDHIIDNSGPLTATIRQTRELWRLLARYGITI